MTHPMAVEHLSKRIYDLAKAAARADGTREADLDAAAESYLPEARRFLAMYCEMVAWTTDKVLDR